MKQRPSAPSLKQRQFIKAICDRFKDQLLGGRRPCIEDYLQRAPGGIPRELLLFNLLLIEFKHLRRRRAVLKVDEYIARFSRSEEVVHKAFGAVKQLETPTSGHDSGEGLTEKSRNVPPTPSSKNPKYNKKPSSVGNSQSARQMEPGDAHSRDLSPRSRGKMYLCMGLAAAILVAVVALAFVIGGNSRSVADANGTALEAVSENSEQRLEGPRTSDRPEPDRRSRESASQEPPSPDSRSQQPESQPPRPQESREEAARTRGQTHARAEPEVQWQQLLSQLPSQIQLPQPDDLQPLALATVPVVGPIPCQIEVHDGLANFDDSAGFQLVPQDTQTGYSFDLTSDTEARSRRHTNVLMPEPNEVTQTKSVANLRLADGKLLFAWESAAASIPSAVQLQNCVLTFTMGNVRHAMCLRKPKYGLPLPLAPKDHVRTVKILSSAVPNPETIVLELSPLAADSTSWKAALKESSIWRNYVTPWVRSRYSLSAPPTKGSKKNREYAESLVKYHVAKALYDRNGFLSSERAEVRVDKSTQVKLASRVRLELELQRSDDELIVSLDANYKEGVRWRRLTMKRLTSEFNRTRRSYMENAAQLDSRLDNIKELTETAKSLANKIRAINPNDLNVRRRNERMNMIATRAKTLLALKSENRRVNSLVKRLPEQVVRLRELSLFYAYATALEHAKVNYRLAARDRDGGLQILLAESRTDTGDLNRAARNLHRRPNSVHLAFALMPSLPGTTPRTYY